jgi:hypothetical protein
MLNYLKDEIRDFSEEKFGVRTDASGPLHHLQEEVEELIDVLGKGGLAEEEEWADCLLLLLDAFRIRYGNDTSFNKLLHFALNKLDVIKKRDWDVEPDENGVYHSRK